VGCGEAADVPEVPGLLEVVFDETHVCLIVKLVLDSNSALVGKQQLENVIMTGAPPFRTHPTSRTAVCSEVDPGSLA
jgi:hypothetical protein